MAVVVAVHKSGVARGLVREGKDDVDPVAADERALVVLSHGVRLREAGKQTYVQLMSRPRSYLPLHRTLFGSTARPSAMPLMFLQTVMCRAGGGAAANSSPVKTTQSTGLSDVKTMLIDDPCVR